VIVFKFSTRHVFGHCPSLFFVYTHFFGDCILSFYGELFGPHPTLNLEGHPFSFVRDCLFSISAVTGGGGRAMPCDKGPMGSRSIHGFLLSQGVSEHALGNGPFLQDAGERLPDYTASHPVA
jgi:hypothetical protein